MSFKGRVIYLGFVLIVAVIILLGLQFLSRHSEDVQHAVGTNAAQITIPAPETRTP